jgi:hypothetical protein
MFRVKHHGQDNIFFLTLDRRQFENLDILLNWLII